MLAPFADGLELNLSCPHAKGYGMAMGQDPGLVADIVSAVKESVSIPMVPKLTPNTDRIKPSRRCSQRGGRCAMRNKYRWAGSPHILWSRCAKQWPRRPFWQGRARNGTKMYSGHEASQIFQSWAALALVLGRCSGYERSGCRNCWCRISTVRDDHSTNEELF